MKNTTSVLTALIVCAGALSAGVVYDSIPSPQPGNVTSLGYQATSTAEFGNAVTLGADGYILDKFTVLMSVWALQADYSNTDPNGFNVPITVNLYEYGAGGAVGSRFATKTIDALIPWRPVASSNCTGGRWMDAGGNCFNGMAVPIDFEFAAQGIELPQTFIFGIAFNTFSHGYAPTGVHGPYESLNVGASGYPTVGSNVFAGGVYLNSTWAGAYSDNGAGGVGTFRLDPSGWSGYNPTVRIEVVPEPTAASLAGTALFLLVGGRVWLIGRRKRVTGN